MNDTESRIEFRVNRSIVDKRQLFPTGLDLDRYLRSKYGEPEAMGPSPRLRYDRLYVAPDDVYECMVSKLVDHGSKWIDVGCGRDVFPSNVDCATELANRAACLVGIDPSDNVFENELLTERFHGFIEDYQSDQQFDLVTLRMVAEHVVDAEACVKKLSELTTPGGCVVVYTPWKWAPMSLMASAVPFSWHNKLKRLIWDSEEQDTFPTAYHMNTRSDLARLFESAGFDESVFAFLDDCSVTARYLTLNKFEIALRNALNWMRVTYPENCLLGVYQKL